MRTIEIDFLSKLAAFFEIRLKLAARPIVAELDTLGFTQIGFKRERVSDGMVTPSIVMAGVEHRTWADIFVGASGAAHLYFYTAFVEGEVVLTGHYPRPTVLTERAMISGFGDRPLDNLLALHKAAVARMEKRSTPLPVADDARLRIDAAYRFYENPDANQSDLVPKRSI